MKTVPRYKWQPTTAEVAAAAGIAEHLVERFDHNTSPTPSSWAAGVVAGTSSRLNEYPAASYRTLRAAVAERTGLKEENVVPGAGADELILLVARGFLEPGATALSVTPTYPLYRIASAQVGADFVEVPAAAPNFEFPGDRVIEEAATADLVWLCVPNNPVGSPPHPDVIDSIAAAASGPVVVDAAYAEFAGDDWAQRVARHDNLIVLHTLSKAYGLAGARVGYALAHPESIDVLDAVRPPGSIGSLSVELAIAALAMPARMQATVAELLGARSQLESGLVSLGFRVLPSVTNFVICEVGPRAAAVHADLMAEGLVVRKYPAGSPLKDYLRFTVRTPLAHRRLLEAIRRSLQ